MTIMAVSLSAKSPLGFANQAQRVVSLDHHWTMHAASTGSGFPLKAKAQGLRFTMETLPVSSMWAVDQIEWTLLVVITLVPINVKEEAPTAWLASSAEKSLEISVFAKSMWGKKDFSPFLRKRHQLLSKPSSHHCPQLCELVSRDIVSKWRSQTKQLILALAE